MRKNKISDFLRKKNVIISFNRYCTGALGAMLLGLFSSLLIGTILMSLGETVYKPDVLFSSMINLSGQELAEATASLSTLGQLAWLLYRMGNYATIVTGAAMAVAIGYSLEAPPLVLFSLAAVGQATNDVAGYGGPLAVFFVAVFASEIGKLVSKETKIDILVTPLATVFSGISLALVVGPICRDLCNAIGMFIGWSTNLQPLLMGIIVSVTVGAILTLPISSAALCTAIGLSGQVLLNELSAGTVSIEIWNGLALAGGAALAGCCAHTLGFAVISYPDNGINGFVAQALGTPMLQFPNLIRKPVLWLPPIITSAIVGPLSTCIFQLRNNGSPVSSGMGTSGLVGPIGVVTGWANMPEGYAVTIADGLYLILLCFVLPLILNLCLGALFRKKGWIQPGDLKIDLG